MRNATKCTVPKFVASPTKFIMFLSETDSTNNLYSYTIRDTVQDSKKSERKDNSCNPLQILSVWCRRRRSRFTASRTQKEDLCLVDALETLGNPAKDENLFAVRVNTCRDQLLLRPGAYRITSVCRGSLSFGECVFLRGGAQRLTSRSGLTLRSCFALYTRVVHDVHV